MDRVIEYPQYSDLESSLRVARCAAGAAELHGGLCAAMVVPEMPESGWLEELLGADFDVQGSDLGRMVGDLLSATRVLLVDPDFRFQPLLPDDHEPVAVRSEALGQWCQGFLYGLGAAGVESASLERGDIRDFVQHLSHFAQADTEAEDSEQNEQALTEVIEYLRMGVLMLQAELARRPGEGSE